MRKNEICKSNEEQKGFISKMFSGKKGILNMQDIGRLCKELKDDNPRFTGRAVHAVSEAVKKRINDYEIPEDWYTDPKIFFEKDYTTKTNMLRELCVKVDGNIIAEELKRYGESEKRYATDKFESDTVRRVHDLEVQAEAMKRFAEKKK